MTSSSSVAGDARRALGPVGVFLPFPTTSAPPVDLQRDAVRRLERAGYRAAWTNEAVGGKDALVQLAVLWRPRSGWCSVPVSPTSGPGHRRPRTPRRPCWLRPIPAGSCWASVSATHSRRPALAGISAARSPRCASTWTGWAPRPSCPHPTWLIPDHRRERPEDARAGGRDHRRSAARLGAARVHRPGQAALGPDKLLVTFMHATIEQDDASAIMATVRGHLAAGADHVLLGQPIGTDFTAGVDHLEQLAPALAELA